MKTNTKLIIIAVSVFLGAVLVITFIGRITDGFQKDLDDVTILERSEDNLLLGKFDDYNEGDGISINSNKLGALTVNGEYKGTEEFLVVELEKLNLASGTYTLSGAPKGGNYTYHLRAVYGDDTVVGDFGSAKGTFTLSSSQEVTIELVIYPDEQFNRLSIKPVLVVGDKAGDFYE